MQYVWFSYKLDREQIKTHMLILQWIAFLVILLILLRIHLRWCRQGCKAVYALELWYGVLNKTLPSWYPHFAAIAAAAREGIHQRHFLYWFNICIFSSLLRWLCPGEFFPISLFDAFASISLTWSSFKVYHGLVVLWLVINFRVLHQVCVVW